MSDETAVKSKKAEVVPTPRPPNSLLAILEAIFVFIGETAMLAAQSLGALLRGGIAPADLLGQMSAIGVDSIWIVLVITTATGGVFAFYIATLANSIGFTQLVGGTLGYAFLNELGPLLGGIALAARAGAEIAAEIGSMVVTEQVDALRAMAVSPIRYLVAPRVFAALIMLPLLTVLANISGLVGGFLFARSAGIPAGIFWESLRTYATAPDMISGLLKSIVFGFIVGVVACQQGLRTKGGATGVGRATTSSVVLCVVLIFVADLFLTQILTKTIQRR